MNNIKYLAMASFAALTLSVSLFPGTVMAANGSITIIEPADGTELMSGSGDELKYNVTLSPNGNHLHVYVDNRSPMIVRKVKNCPCSVSLPMLGSGSHTIAVKEATAGHSLTGLESSVTFTVK
jgi:hypothetical protein